MGNVAVIDYGIGNLRSAQKALETLGATAKLTSDSKDIESADAVVLPGVGAFGATMGALRGAGLGEVAIAAVDADIPFIGICVGMQMLYEGSEESPDVEGLGILKGQVKALPSNVLHPQMQWNRLNLIVEDHPMFAGIDDPWVYFVHSYAAESSEDVIATCEYGIDVTAAVSRDNLWATQFHPEKSGEVGMAILANFLRWAEGKR